MLFYSFEFLFIFLPVTLAGYWIICGLSHNNKISISWLVLCSVVFYGMWNISYVSLIICSIIFNYYSGVLLQRIKSLRKRLLIFSISANLSLLAYYKYANFFIDNVNNIANTDITLCTIILPLAISFFTFQQISWLVDSYKNIVNTRTEGLWRYALFVTFFPQLIAGPIVHHSEMMPQFSEKNNFHINWKNINIGLTIFIFGLFKKIVLADNLSPFVNNIFNDSLNNNNIHILDSWIGMFAYTFQLYF
ncbi:MAG: MBOAT family protein, partial [Alphaproteobacteria bacterium]|nr:MBOAT family protein [Alphaproteobacteria bacterium]